MKRKGAKSRQPPPNKVQKSRLQPRRRSTESRPSAQTILKQDGPEASLAPIPASNPSQLVGNRRFAGTWDEKARGELHMGFMSKGLMPMRLQVLQELKKIVNSQGNNVINFDRIEAMVRSQRAFDVTESVKQIFVISRTALVDNQAAMAHLARCRSHWLDVLQPRVQEAEVDWASSQEKTASNHCTLCKLGSDTVELPTVKMFCVECDNDVGSGASVCYVLVADNLHAVLCNRCALKKRPKAAGGNWEVGGNTFRPNQVHVVTGSVLCGARKEEAVLCECGKWEAVLCVAAVNPRLLEPDTVHVCNDCLAEEPHSSPLIQGTPDEDPCRASNVPQADTERAKFITLQLTANLTTEGIKGRFIVFEGSRVTEEHDMAGHVRSFLRALWAEGTEETISFLQSTFFLVNLDDVLMRDTLVAGISLHEYTSRPAKGTAYVSYLDSLNHVPSSIRSPAIRAFFAMVAKSAAYLGSTSLKLYALSPDANAYIFWERPADMLVSQDPKGQQGHLVKWYDTSACEFETLGLLALPDGVNVQSLLSRNHTRLRADMDDPTFLNHLIPCKDDINLREVEKAVAEVCPDGNWTEERLAAAKRAIADAMAAKYDMGHAMYHLPLRPAPDQDVAKGWVDSEMAQPLLKDMDTFRSALRYKRAHLTTPLSAAHTTRELMYHLRHPEVPFFRPRCTRCTYDIPTPTYFGCSAESCKKKGPMFCAACVQDMAKDASLEQKISKNNPHFVAHTGHLGRNDKSAWVELEIGKPSDEGAGGAEEMKGGDE